jgi:hypothetical protein
MSGPLRVSDFVALNIYLAEAGQQAPNVSTPMLIAYHGITPGRRVLTYNSLAAMVADGFSVYKPPYLMAAALQAQPNPPTSWKIGRRASAPVFWTNLTCLTDTVGQTIEVTLVAPDGSEHTYTRTCAGGGIPAEATALAALMNVDHGTGGGGSTELVFTGVVNDVTVRPGAGAVTGQIFYFKNLKNLDIVNNTADPGLAADITAIRAEDDDWYYAMLDNASLAENTVLATQTASTAPNYKLAMISTQDSTCREGTAGNIMLVTQAATRDRASVWYSPYSMSEYPAVALAGQMSTANPGQTIAAMRALRGVTPAGTRAWDLSLTQMNNIFAARGNVYTTLGSTGVTVKGTCAALRWIDDRILLDWLAANIPTELYNAMATRVAGGYKVPYTDEAGEFARGPIVKVLEIAAGWGGVTLKDPATGVDYFSFSYTPASSQLAADKALRIFRGVRFGCRLNGAVQQYLLEGYLNPA